MYMEKEDLRVYLLDLVGLGVVMIADYLSGNFSNSRKNDFLFCTWREEESRTWLQEARKNLGLHIEVSLRIPSLVTSYI